MKDMLNNNRQSLKDPEFIKVMGSAIAVFACVEAIKYGLIPTQEDGVGIQLFLILVLIFGLSFYVLTKWVSVMYAGLMFSIRAKRQRASRTIFTRKVFEYPFLKYKASRYEGKGVCIYDEANITSNSVLFMNSKPSISKNSMYPMQDLASISLKSGDSDCFTARWVAIDGGILPGGRPEFFGQIEDREGLPHAVELEFKDGVKVVVDFQKRPTGFLPALFSEKHISLQWVLDVDAENNATKMFWSIKSAKDALEGISIVADEAA